MNNPIGTFRRFKAPIGIGAMHREYEILCYFNGTPNSADTQERIDNETSYGVAIQDLIQMGLIEKDGESYVLTIPGGEILRLCHE